MPARHPPTGPSIQEHMAVPTESSHTGAFRFKARSFSEKLMAIPITSIIIFTGVILKNHFERLEHKNFYLNKL